jgi:ATP-binding cassette, subfamily B, heavy metal transporter
MNVGQNIIFDTYMMITTMVAALDIYAGKWTVGGFLFLQALFMRLEGILEWQGWYMKRFVQTEVDSQDLYQLLNTDPMIKEKEDAKPFQLKEGKIEF